MEKAGGLTVNLGGTTGANALVPVFRGKGFFIFKIQVKE
jgi:hypothetical protein